MWDSNPRTPRVKELKSFALDHSANLSFVKRARQVCVMFLLDFVVFRGVISFNEFLRVFTLFSVESSGLGDIVLLLHSNESEFDSRIRLRYLDYLISQFKLSNHDIFIKRNLSNHYSYHRIIFVTYSKK